QLNPTSFSNFFCRVTNPLGMFDSRTAVVTFTADTEKPTVVVLSSPDGAALTVRVSEAVDPVSAGDSFNYSIGAGFTIDSVSLKANPTDVLLRISPAMAIGSTLTLMVSGVSDLANNTMVDTQVVVKAHVITYGCARYDYYLGLAASTVGISALTGAPGDLYC